MARHRTAGPEATLYLSRSRRRLLSGVPWRSPQFTGSFSRPGPRKHTQTLPARPSSSDPYGPTRRDGCDRAGLSPLARARGVRRCPRAQTLLLEHGDTFEDSTRVVHHRSLGHLLRVVDKDTNSPTIASCLLACLLRNGTGPRLQSRPRETLRPALSTQVQSTRSGAASMVCRGRSAP